MHFWTDVRRCLRVTTRNHSRSSHFPASSPKLAKIHEEGQRGYYRSCVGVRDGLVNVNSVRLERRDDTKMPGSNTATRRGKKKARRVALSAPHGSLPHH